MEGGVEVSAVGRHGQCVHPVRERPVPLAWLGVVSSAAAVVVLPLEFVDLFPSRWIWYVWLPLAAYEVPLALWLLMKGAAAPPARSAMAA